MTSSPVSLGPETTTLAKGTLIWFRDDSQVWKSGSILNATQTDYVVETRGGEETVTIPKTHEICLRNKDQFSSEGLVVLDDLTQLTHLNEPAVLHSLQIRFDIDKIYTFTGPILIAVNPFKRIPDLYNDETLTSFISLKPNSVPHVFATANAAFRGLCDRQKCQTVLISGESGAGKTESTKYVMKFLACAGSNSGGERTEIEKQVLDSNPLLEAFGNARTLRNDNSSRFGKFIELQFKLDNDAAASQILSNDGLSELNAARLCGARIQTYLLEKVRVTDQQEGERNFHIFYQCCAAAAAFGDTYDFPQFPKRTRSGDGNGAEKISLDLRGFSDHSQFHYLTRSSVISLEDVDDLIEFEKTIAAMRTIGIPNSDINAILNSIASTLLLGNTNFVMKNIDNTEGSSVEENCKITSFKQACTLLGIDMEALEQALTTKTITTRGETYVSPIPVSHANDYRDALARQLYGLLFLRIVDRTNNSIGYLNNVRLFCGVLDIFGFECFKVNSFEQLCINFTNERLQQFFNTFVFKLEEELYKKEDIPWDPLDFPDNQDAVDLLADPRSGIFSMLDEECLVPQGSDKGFCNKIVSKYNQHHKRFDVIKTKQDWFVIRHFAGPVGYSSENFLEKNKDQLPQPVYDVMKASDNQFIASLFVEQETRRLVNQENSSPGRASFGGPGGGGGRESVGGGGPRRKIALTVSNEFKDQLQLLMETVKHTEPHFIRCIKPNPQNLPDVYDRPSVCEQLRYGGVLQAVQVSRAGYPVRAGHADMWLDFKCIIPRHSREKFEKIQPRDQAQHMMQILEIELKIPRHPITNSVSWAVGKSLVFMKHEAYERLQSARLKLRNDSSTKIQARYRAMMAKKYFAKIKLSMVRLQALWRGKLARIRVEKIRQEKAALFLQSVARMTIQRLAFLRSRSSAIHIQSVWKGIIARRKFSTLKEDRAASKIQSVWRGKKTRTAYTQLVCAVGEIQRHWRMRAAKMQLRRLKQEAKEVGSLLAKYQSAQMQIQELKRRNDDLEGSKVHLVSERLQLSKRVEILEDEIKVLKSHESETVQKLKLEISGLKDKIVSLETTALSSISISASQVVGGPAIVPPLPSSSSRLGSPEVSPTIPGSNNSPQPTSSAVSAALDSFKSWLGVKGGGTTSGGSKNHSLGVLQSSLKGTKSMKAACKDPDALSDLRPVQELQDGESAVTCICFGQEKIHKGYILLAAASKDGTVVIYRCYRTEMERLSLNEAEFPREDPQSSNGPTPSEHGNIVVHCRLTGHTRAITSLFFSLLEDMVVTTSIDKSVRFWNADTGEMLKVFTDSSPVPVACFLPFNPSVFVAANSNAVLRLVNATNGMVLQKLKVEAEVRALKFDDTGLFLLAGTKNGSVHVLEACDNATLRFKFKLQLARGSVTCITFVSARNGQPPCLLVNSSDSSVTIVDCVYGPPGSVLINLNVRHRVKVAHSLLPLKCCYSPSDQGYLVSGSEDKGVYVFSLAKGSNYKMQVLNHHQVPVVAVTTNQQDTLLASADSLGRIVLWRRLDFSHIATWQPTQVINPGSPALSQ